MTEYDELLWFTTERGQEALAAAEALPPKLELHRTIEVLRRRFEPELVSAALRMTELRRRAAAKFSRASAMLFTAEGLEQSSSEIVASYRAERFRDHGPFTDLCCGIGSDTIALAGVAQGMAVDIKPLHVYCCMYNVNVYNRHKSFTVDEDSVLDTPIPSGTVFIDPSRRSGGRRVRSGEDYSPRLSWVLDLAQKVEGLGAKLSPALQFDDEESLDNGGSSENEDLIESPLSLSHLHGTRTASEMEIISLDGVCREMVLWTGCFATCKRKATVIRRRSPHSFEYDAFFLQTDGLGTGGSPPMLTRLPHPGEYLLEPDPAVIRARLISDLAESLDGRFIDEQIAYLISAAPPTTPFAAVYRVLDAFPYSQKRLKEWLAQRGVGNLTVKKRGFPLSPEEVRAKLRLKGSVPATVVLTRAGGQHIAVLVEGPMDRYRGYSSFASGQASGNSSGTNSL